LDVNLVKHNLSPTLRNIFQPAISHKTRWSYLFFFC